MSASLVTIAHHVGRTDRERGRMRVAPFYNESVVINGKRVDITPILTTAWLAGYDGESLPDEGGN